MNQSQLIVTLKKQLDKLQQEVLQHDARLEKDQTKLLQHTDRFNSALFNQSGAKLSPCIAQIRKSIEQLEKRLQVGLNKAAIEVSCQQIQDQFSAAKRAIHTTGINLKAEQHKKSIIRNRYLKKQQKQHSDSGFDWIASNVMHNSHQMYEELNKHLNWASRMKQKIKELELQLESSAASDKLKLQHEILTMHKRLGKCNQAISYIEERIQLLEKPNYRRNR
ncbi:MAG: primosomal replication protein [Parashewanella sp.]